MSVRRRGRAVARRQVQVSSGQRRHAGVVADPPRAGEPSPHHLAALSVRRRAALKLGEWGAWLRLVRFLPVGISPVLAPLLAVPPICRPGLAQHLCVSELVLSGSGGGSGTEPFPP